MTKPSGEATPRRHFLRTLVLAPAAAAAVGGCAAPRGAARPDAGAAQDAGAAGAAPAAAPAAEDAGLRAVRGVPLDLSAEPVLVFRATPARPGE
jgi:hypothetical protein